MKMCFPVWNGWVRTWTCPDGAAEGGHAEVDCRGLEWIAASFEWSIFCVLLTIRIPHTESRLPVAGFLCCAARPSPNNCTRDCFMFLCNFFFRDDEKPSRNTFTACTTDNKTRDNVYNRTLQKNNHASHLPQQIAAETQKHSQASTIIPSPAQGHHNTSAVNNPLVNHITANNMLLLQASVSQTCWDHISRISRLNWG
jgi:hypothetical protein